MNFQRRKLAVATACALGVGSGAIGLNASAQDIRIEVTGSNIKRVDMEGPAPVSVVTREDIERRGATTVAEVLRNLPSAGGFTFDDQFTNSFAPGTAGVGLRNLGQNATLVLVNGRRVANYGFAQNIDLAFVDLNSIPVGAIERIEVLKDGASAIYGSDAIAGVVNIILRKDFRGVEVAGSYGVTERGDGDETRASITAGWGDLAKDKFNVMGVVDYFKREPIFLGDRDYSKTANMEGRGGFDLRSPSGSPGTWVQRSGTSPGFSLSQPFPDCPPESIWTDVSGGPGCAFNFNPYIATVPETERKAVFGRLTWDITSSLQLFGEASYNNTVTNTTAAPTPASFVLPVGHNSNPWSAPVTIRYRYVDAGPRLNEIDTDATRFLAGLRGSVKNWDWEVAGLYAKSDSTNTGTNYISATEQAALVSRGVYNFLNPSLNSPELVDSLKIRTTRIGESEMKLFDAKATGPIFDLPAGPLQLAVGAEYREDDLADTPDPESVRGNVVGSGGTAAKGSRDVTSFYGELSIPLHKTLEAQLALRYDNYSDFGNTTNPKIALRWQPSKQLLIRGSYAEGFRAPSLVELYLGNTTSFVTFVDQPRCDAYRAGGGTATEVAGICRPLQYRTVSGGNPNLEPETSKSWFLGFVFEPTDQFSVGLDYWKIDHKNIIDQPLIQFQLENEATFPGSIHRYDRTSRDIAVGAPGELHGAGSDETTGVDRLFFNIASQKAEGIDVSFRHRGNLGDWGRLTSTLDATYNIHYKFAAAPGEPLDEYNGTYNYPRWRANLTFDWERGPWNTTVFINYIHHYYQLNGDFVPYVDSWTTTDLQVQYKGFKNWTLALGVKNLFDRDPPFSDQETQGYDFTTHNPVGRFYYGRVKYSFQ
jgi:outer membrane receptor protein involved in Fe transport